ncbi:PEP-CTERM-box response regulator transcription factor [Spartinivicinus poritis]|uniref:PEP-CTERM-box response regulator transcription factor n=1 Tax=Spartinivicinus poritis TaxID=2994640 RepID=A0ABT5UGI1_9GAMM|nr:PEP-CTERM-box response regulator transcription factor [Spartinivicinus sp. A2-2]MDE1464592.1 PEP-CTERM-box response regulator transcription factor [Spartinivicinus sp. A2-2]
MSDIKRTLLIVEDDPGLQKQLKWCFEGYETIICGTREEAIKHLRRTEPQVVTVDLGLPPDPANASEGLKTVEQILSLSPQTKVIVVTGNDDRENAIRSIALGAYDFYQKPIDTDVLGLIIERAFHVHALEQENQRLQQKYNAEPLSGIIACSESMQKITRSIEKIAPTDVGVLLLGESGTGKEVLARAIHNLSERKKNNFVAVNCAAIPENLLESELFGYEKGAFTGAVKQTKGKIEYAVDGTFFLDEVGDLPMSLQAKLLRFLQERTIERVGGREEIPVDVRVICATHQNLPKLIDDGRFREDLYYRISEITLKIPPLRERHGDAVVIARNLLQRFNEQHKRNLKGFSNDALDAISSYHWPGNIRELENRLKRAVVMADGKMINAEDLELENVELNEFPFNLKEVREKAEKEVINRAIGYTNKNISKTADLLGVTRPTLYSLMHKYGIME